MIPGLGLVVVAAGSSARMGGVDKVWATLGSHSVVWHSVRTLGPLAERVVVVVRAGDEDRAEDEFASAPFSVYVVVGGPTRQDSVACGMRHLTSVHIVAVHDAARPFAEPRLLRQGVELVQSCDAAIPGIPVADTIKQVDEHGSVVQTLERTALRSVQTPQVFRFQALVDAHASTDASLTSATDDAALLEACRYDVRVFPGQVDNFKITTEYDLRVARLLMADGPTN